MQAATHLHVGMARELTALRAVVCSTVELVLGRPADEPSITPWGYCSSYSTSIVASTVFIQWLVQYKPNSMKMVFSTNGVGLF
jgi:hypothetical protein